MNRYTVKVRVNGYIYGSIRVIAEDVETAGAKAIDTIFLIATKRAATVAASGGPKWAAVAPNWSDITVASVRKMGIAA